MQHTQLKILGNLSLPGGSVYISTHSNQYHLLITASVLIGKKRRGGGEEGSRVREMKDQGKELLLGK